jgi:diphthamide synthase (EF-2-diphthine--ammonia ligase)
MKVSELEKVFDLEVRDLVRLDNNKLDGFIEHFKNEDCNQTSCAQCNYCETVFERVAVVKKKEVEQAAQKVRNFSEKLVSGEIFEIPRSHFIFRFPPFKSLLKHLVKSRLRRE